MEKFTLSLKEENKQIIKKNYVKGVGCNGSYGKDIWRPE